MDFFTPFTGRFEELERLGSLLDDSLEYNGRLVFVRGPIGIGKTRLLNQFTESIRDRGFHILETRVSVDSSMAVSPFIRMVDNFICRKELSPSWIARNLPPDIAGYFLELIPRLRDIYPIEVPKVQKTDTKSIIYAFLEFIRSLSRSRSIVMLLDDLQWLDRDGIRFLRYLAFSIRDLPVIVIGAIRTGTETPVLDELVDELSSHRILQNIDLKELAKDEVGHLLTVQFGGEPPESFRRWLVSTSRGNPLFIEEIIRALIRQNIIRREDGIGEWTFGEDYRDFRVSKTIESVIGFRIGQLSATETGTMECAAVIGDIFDLETLRALLPEVAKTDVQSSVNILLSLGMITPSTGEYNFAHPLIRHVIYSRMNEATRRLLHRKLADVLQDRNGDEREIALHLTRDLLPEEETPEMALRLLELSLSFLEKTEDFTSAWDYIGTAWRIAQKPGISQRDRLRIQAEYFLLEWNRGISILSIEDIHLMLDGLIEHQLTHQAALTYRLLFHKAMVEQELDRAGEYLNRGMGLLTESDELYWYMRTDSSLLKRRLGLLQQSMDEALALVRDIPQDLAPGALYNACSSICMGYYLSGRLKEARIHALRAREVVRDHGIRLMSANSQINLGLILMSMGEIDDALLELKEALSEARMVHLESRVEIALFNMAFCHYYRWEYAQALKYLDEAAGIRRGRKAIRLELLEQNLRVRIHMESGQLEEALEIQRGISLDSREVDIDWESESVGATLALEMGQLDMASERIDRVMLLAQKRDSPTRIGSGRSLRALLKLRLGDTKGAFEDMTSAESILLESGAIPIFSRFLIKPGFLSEDEIWDEFMLRGIDLLERMKAPEALRIIRERLMKTGSHRRVLERIKETSAELYRGRVEVLSFGGLSIRRPGDTEDLPRSDWGYGKSQELLALLLALRFERGATREFLASHLWPDMEEKRAQGNLRVAFTHLRKAIGEQAILQSGQRVSLNRELITSDLWRFDSLTEEWHTLLRDGKVHAAEDRAGKAMTLYRGDFVPEFYSTPLEDEQFRLQNVMRELLLWSAERCMERLEYRASVRHARRLLSMDPCSETACRLIMSGLASSGDRAGAIRQYCRLEKSLMIEFNTVPCDETRELYSKLIAGG